MKCWYVGTTGFSRINEPHDVHVASRSQHKVVACASVPDQDEVYQGREGGALFPDFVACGG